MERFASFVPETGGRLGVVVAVAGTALLPLIFMAVGKEAFRAPKEIGFHIAAER